MSLKKESNDTMIPDTLITSYLEMTDYAQFKPDYIQNANIKTMEITQPDLAFYRFLYKEVGEMWRWRDRAIMSNEELLKALKDAQIFVIYFYGNPAGYVELAPMDDTGSMEIAYFGLREPYFGKGLGKHLLSYGIERAWKSGAKRVWVHTCNLDGPAALPNYQKRGFTVYDETRVPMPQRYSE